MTTANAAIVIAILALILAAIANFLILWLSRPEDEEDGE